MPRRNRKLNVDAALGHAVDRARQRYGIHLIVEDIRKIEEQCREAKPLGENGKAKLYALWWYEPRPMIIYPVVHRTRGHVLTFLHADMAFEAQPGMNITAKELQRQRDGYLL